MVKKKYLFAFIILIIIVFLVFSFVVNASELENNLYYKINMNYNDGQIKIESVNIEFEEIENYLDDADKKNLKIIKKDSSVLEDIYFSVPDSFVYDISDENGIISEGGEGNLEEIIFNIYVPYHENAYQAVIYDKDGKEIDRELLSQFSKQGFDIGDFREENEIRTESVDDYPEQKEDVIKENVFERFNESDYKNIIISLIVILIALIVVEIVAVKKGWK